MKCSLLVLSSYLDGELESRRQGELEAHLVGCQRCRAGLGYLREEVERISALGHVHVSGHSVDALLAQLGLIDGDEDEAESRTAVGVAERPAWFGQGAATTPPPREEHEDFRWVAPEASRQAAPARDEAPPPEHEPPAPPPFTWRSASPTPERDEGVPAVPFGLDAAPPAVPPAAASEPEPPGDAAPVPATLPVWPPPTSADPAGDALSAPGGGAFPPGGPETSDRPEHVTASGGEDPMTASPPWAPHQAPPEPVYPLTDDDVLTAPMPVERFGPPQEAPRPSLFERLRDRLATRRALSRSASGYDDSVQIVSGSGAPLRLGRARLEVERRRQETLRMDPGEVPGSAIAADDELAGDDDLGLGPLPPPAAPLAPTPMPRPAPRPPATHPGQMSLPGTVAGAATPPPPRFDDARPPISRTPMPPPRHTLSSALGDPLPPARMATPPALPPRPPTPDPLGDALTGIDRAAAGGPGTPVEPRPWRPREFAEDPRPVAAPPQFTTGRAAARVSPGHVPGPSQLREGRRLLALFGAATLLMLAVGVASGRTTSPLPSSTSTARQSTPPHPQATHAAPAASAAPTQITLGPAVQPAAPSATTAQLTGVKVVGDGGTGYQIKQFRYGVHPGDFRIVLDLDASGSAAGAPRVTVGFLDSTTLVIALNGVLAAGSTGSLPSSNPVVSVTLMQQSPVPGATAYELKLAHPVTFSVGYQTSPLRLVVDLAG